ncbi:MAG: molybdopterin-dependent oxidoreductase, partial [Myxococcales bacterium]|nr:molybdopterin-dependent oxidoreductase [Myxococcales bacterium]
VGLYLGNPNVHNLGSLLLGSTFYRALRSQNLFTATSVDQLPHHVAARHLFGHYFLLPVPDLDRTQHLLILGANPLVSNGSLMTTGGAKPRLQALRQRGGKMVVVDPRRTETAVFADEHHFITPGSDVLLLLAMVQTMFAEGLVNLGTLAPLVDGVAEVEALTAPYAPQRVAAATGIAADTIRTMARELAAAASGVVYGRMGLST